MQHEILSNNACRARDLCPAVEEAGELVDGCEHLQKILESCAEGVKSPKNVLLTETELLRFLNNLCIQNKSTRALNYCYPFVLDLCVGLPVLGVELDALRQLVLDHLPLLQQKITLGR